MCDSTAFSLHSPSSASDGGERAARASLRRICEEANLLYQPSCSELMRMLPLAENHMRDGCNTRAAWGRFAAQYLELLNGRGIVELLLVCKLDAGN